METDLNPYLSSIDYTVIDLCSVYQILDLANCKDDVRKKVHAVIEKYAEHGLRSLAVARQVRILTQC